MSERGGAETDQSRAEFATVRQMKIWALAVTIGLIEEQ
jgi:hypothetical protein